MTRPVHASLPLASSLATRVAHLTGLVLLGGCVSTETFVPSPCDVALYEIKPSAAAAGETVTATGRPFTSAYDTAVYVDTERAVVLSLERDRCESCDACLEEEGCTGCDDCDACDPVCSSCWEAVTFEIPALPGGSSLVRLFNRHGESSTLPLQILGDEDSGRGDSSVEDSASHDSVPDETAAPDTGMDSGRDTSASDSGAGDSASGETGHP